MVRLYGLFELSPVSGQPARQAEEISIADRWLLKIGVQHSRKGVHVDALASPAVEPFSGKCCEAARQLKEPGLGHPKLTAMRCP